MDKEEPQIDYPEAGFDQAVWLKSLETVVTLVDKFAGENWKLRWRLQYFEEISFVTFASIFGEEDK